MKVCFITEDFYPDFIGGQGIYGKNLVEQLAKKNVLITVIAENKRERKKYWRHKKNIKLILVPFCFGNQLILAFLEYLYFIIHERKNYYDIVHANQLSGLFFILFRRKNVRKIVVSVHNTNYDMQQVEENWLKKLAYLPLVFLEKIIYQKADGILFNSLLEQKDLLKYFQIKNKLSRSINLGRDPVLITDNEREKARESVRKKLHLPDNAKIILFIGRLVKRKKIDILIKITNKFYKNNKIYTIIIGKGRELNRLKKLSSANARFLGFVSDTRPYLLAADLFVTISVAEGGFTLSSLEAAGYGLPLLLSKQAGGEALIVNGKNGYIVSPDNSTELAEKILLSLKQQENFSKESLRLSKSFSWKKTAKGMLDFYKKFL